MKTSLALLPLAAIALQISSSGASAVDRPTEVKITALIEINERLKPFEDRKDIPEAFAKWMEQMSEVTVFETDPKGGEGRYIGPDADALIRRNPQWWTIVFAAGANGHLLDVIYSQILLAAGEAERSVAYSRFSLLRPGITDNLADAHLETARLCHDATQSADALVKKGTLLHDRLDFAGAIRAYDDALKIWPKHALAHYEKGFSLRLAALAKAGRALPADGEASISANGEDELLPPVAVASYDQARRCFPFNFMYYQGRLPAIVVEKLATGMPRYDDLMEHMDKIPDEEAMTDLIEMCGAVGAHDYALLLLRARIERAGTVTENDLREMKRNLTALIGAAAAARIMEDISVGEIEQAEEPAAARGK